MRQRLEFAPFFAMVRAVKNLLTFAALPLALLTTAPAISYAGPVKKAAAKEDPALQKIATEYLAALQSTDTADGKEHLLGGVTIDAKNAHVLNASVVKKSAIRSEIGSLADVSSLMRDLDAAGFKMLGQETAANEPSSAPSAVDLPQALELLKKTRELRQAMLKKFPVLSDVVRVDRALYWHTKNPMRPVLKQAGREGSYEVHHATYTIESKDDAKSAARQWPLRFVRFKSGSVDTGWKVLPASEWDPET